MPYFDHALLPVPYGEQVRHGRNGENACSCMPYFLSRSLAVRGLVRFVLEPAPNHALLLGTGGAPEVRHGRSQEFCSGPCLTWPRSPGPRSKAWPGAGIQARPCLTWAFVLQWESPFCGNCPFVSGHSAGSLVGTGGTGSKTWSRAAFFARDHGTLAVHPVPTREAGQHQK